MYNDACRRQNKQIAMQKQKEWEETAEMTGPRVLKKSH